MDSGLYELLGWGGGVAGMANAQQVRKGAALGGAVGVVERLPGKDSRLSVRWTEGLWTAEPVGRRVAASRHREGHSLGGRMR